MKDKNEFVNVANVHASPQLAWLLKPYNGCPRGPMDLPGLTYESSGGALALLKDAEDYLVKGPDDTFVCVPKMWFDLIVKSLEEPREGTEDQDDQEPPIIEFPFPETKTADKPRLAEVLGVEVGEKFTFYDRELWVDEQGIMYDLDGCVSGYTVCDVVNHPEGIIRAPRLTEPEIAIMRAVGAKWVSKDKTIDWVDLWSQEPVNKYDSGVYLWAPGEKSGYMGEVRASLFPSVKPGDCLCLDGGPYADAGSPGGRAQP